MTSQSSQLPHTAESVIWSAFLAETHAELDQCRHTLLVSVPGPQWSERVELPEPIAARWARSHSNAMHAIAKARSLLRTATARAVLDRSEVAEPAPG
ncbi:MAG: hypothetical protein JWM93_4007 [Frankiales bacterium]|nr:hypothetical protein [Frankiales bacterium]